MGGRRVLLGLLSVLLLFLTAPSAQAACHAFTVSASPATVDEGTSVRITVSRDGAVNPSSIKVSTIDGTASAGSDYTAINETVSFSSETTKTLTLRTTDDSTSEPAETLRVHLSDPAGCAVNPNFSVGPDAQVTIKASDASTTTASTPTTTPSSTPTTVDRAADATTTTDSVVDDTAVTTTSDTTGTSTTAGALDEIAAEDDDGGAPVGLIAAAVIALGVLAAGGLLLYQRRAG